MLWIQQKIAPTKANPLKGGDAKPRTYVHSGYGSRAAEGTEGSESAVLIRCGSRALFCSAPLDGEIVVPSFRFGVIVLSTAPERASSSLPEIFPRRATPSRRPTLCASKDEVGRSHVTPTPDPDPRASGSRAVRRQRPREVALRPAERPPTAGCTALPGRAQDLHFLRLRRTSRTALSVSADAPRLGPALPYITTTTIDR
jgi:hypothetical protein